MIIWRVQNDTLVEGLHFVATCTGVVFAGADEDTAGSAFFEGIGGRAVEAFEYLRAGDRFEALWEGISRW